MNEHELFTVVSQHPGIFIDDGSGAQWVLQQAIRQLVFKLPKLTPQMSDVLRIREEDVLAQWLAKVLGQDGFCLVEARVVRIAMIKLISWLARKLPGCFFGGFASQPIGG